MNITKDYKLKNCWKKIGVYGDKSCELLHDVIHCRKCDIMSLQAKELLNKELQQDIKDNWTELLSTKFLHSALDTKSVMIFRTGDEWLAIETEYLNSVTDYVTYHTVPFLSNDVFLGLVNISGALILCYTLNKIVTSSLNQIQDSKIVLVEFGKEKIAVITNEVLAIEHIPISNFTDLPDFNKNSFHTILDRVFDFNNRKIGLINCGKMFKYLKSSWGKNI